MPIHTLIAHLADGQPHHITQLAAAVSRMPHQLNTLWQKAPISLRGLLRQRDGMWQLARPIVWLPEDYQAPHFHTRVLLNSPSSNDELLQKIKNHQSIHQHSIIALSQTKGRGRQGRTWHAQTGDGLTFSIGWQFARKQADLGTLALVVALACQQALAQLGCAVQIKWPNDLVFGLDKLGGILIETVRQNEHTHAVIGIGINFRQPKNIDGTTAIQTLCSKKMDIIQIFDTIFEYLYTALTQFSQHGFAPFLADYRRAHRDEHREIVILHDQRPAQYGCVAGIAEDGALLLDTENGVQKIVMGEVSLRLPEQIPVFFRQPEDKMARDLLLDAGNSRLKWAWVEGGEMVGVGHAPYRDLSPLREQWQQWGERARYVVGSAVCGEPKKALVGEFVGVPIQWLPSMASALGVVNHYRNVNEHGADRWFNTLGSRRFSHNACVVVSCGTAVTIDAITADGHYLGGSIMPGFHLMRESLVQKTAQLPRVEGMRYPFPTTTANAIASGMMDAVCGAIMLMHARLQERSGYLPTDVVITGGGAAKVAAALPEYFVSKHMVKIVDNLVMHGLLDYLNRQIILPNEGKAA